MLADTIAFANAACHTGQARLWRAPKRGGHSQHTPAQCKAKAREHEGQVREIALQSEIALTRRAEVAGAKA